MGGKAIARACALVLLSLGRPALAAAQHQPRPPRFEIGAEGGVYTAIGRGLAVLVAGGPRLSINLTDRVGFDLIASIVEPNESGGLYGLYGVQVRHVVRDEGPARSAIFVTGGAVGGFEYERVPERRVQRPDGSVVIYRAFTDGEISAPAAFSAGIGMQRTLARFAAFRAEAQGLLGFGGAFVVRGALGISIPVGRAYARTH